MAGPLTAYTADFLFRFAKQRATPIRDLIAKLRHDGCGGRAGRVELLTGIEGASSRPVRKIVLIDR
jgi:hypothetical protein